MDRYKNRENLMRLEHQAKVRAQHKKDDFIKLFIATSGLIATGLIFFAAAGFEGGTLAARMCLFFCSAGMLTMGAMRKKNKEEVQSQAYAMQLHYKNVLSDERYLAAREIRTARREGDRAKAQTIVHKYHSVNFIFSKTALDLMRQKE